MTNSPDRQVSDSIVTSTVAFWSEGSQLSAVLSCPGGGAVYPAVIWSHGYGGYSDAIGAAVVAGHLPGRGFALLRVDHRGCGRSQPSVRGPCVQGSESVQDWSTPSPIWGHAEMSTSTM